MLAIAQGAEQHTVPLKLMGKIPLPAVHGRIGSISGDYSEARLFVAAAGNDSVEVIDARTNGLLASIHEVVEPQSAVFVKSSDRIFVTNASDGSVRLFDATSFKPAGSVHLGSDPAEIRVDATHDLIYAGYGNGAIAVLDPKGKRLGEISLRSHPASFQLAAHQPRLYVNLPDSHTVAVVDTAGLTVLAEWPIPDSRENFPLAIDEEKRRVFVACRRPARLFVFDMDSGSVVARLPTVGDADGLFYDPIHSRIYVTGGVGRIGVYAQGSADQHVALDPVATGVGARTGLFVPEWNRFFVAIRDFGAHVAEIRIYQPQ